jgi:uncharacterized membrane protein
LRRARRTDKIAARTPGEGGNDLTAASMPAVIAERQRLQIIDLIRGIAVVAMIVYHFSWDLKHFGLISVDVGSDPLWRGFAHTIAGTFLGLVGFNLVLANRHGIRTVPYLRRLGFLACGAALVSLVTYWFVPEGFVFFGVLHMILVASVLALPFLRAPTAVTIVAAVFCLAAPSLFTSEIFDAKLLWLGLLLGLSNHLVDTVDYVPVLPWFGVVLAGVATGQFTLNDRAASWLAGWKLKGTAWRPILFVGRWSLPIYLVHQVLLWGIFLALLPLVGPTEEALAARLLDGCVKASCQPSGDANATCQSTCECVASGAAAAGLLTHFMAGNMTDAERRSWRDIIEDCQPKQPPLTRG